MMLKVMVGGTSKVFSELTPISVSNPDFDESFRKDKYELTPKLSGDFLIAFNHDPKLYRRFLDSGGKPSRAVLIRLEPNSVFPAQYKHRITRKYGLVISPGSALPESKHSVRVGWPYKYHLNPANPVDTDPSLVDILESKSYQDLFKKGNWDKRGHLLTMVAANKVSSISGANYLLRRNLSQSLPVDTFAVYGPLWKGPLYPKIHHRLAVLVATLKQGTFPNLVEIYGNLFRSYETARGPVENKHTLLQDSKFSLVIENSNSIVTEKIFDAILNGSIPIYVGPDLNSFGLPNEIAVSVSGKTQEILEITQNMNSANIERYLDTMFSFIKSSNFVDNWSAQSVNKKLATVVHEYLETVT